MADNNLTKNITTRDVVEFVANHPHVITELLTTQPNLLEDALAAASYSKKNNNEVNPKVIDLSPALATKARNDVRKIKQTHQSLLHVATENMINWTRLHHATLGLLASTDLDGMCQVITKEFPVIFDLNQCQLIIENEAAMPRLSEAGLTIRPAAQIDAATNNHKMFLGLPNDAAQALLIKPVQSLAIIRLPDRLPYPVSQSVLLLGGKTNNSFHSDLGGDLLVLLAEIVGVTLAARLELQETTK